MSSAGGERALRWVLRVNPAVATHELRRQMRGWRPFGSLLAWASLCAAAMVTALTIYVIEHTDPSPYSTVGNEAGKLAYTILMATEMGVLLILVPLQAAAAISVEREKRTMEMLRATLLSARDVVTGKMVSVLAMAALMVIIAVPVATWCLMLGGVDAPVVLWSHTYVLATAFWACTLGLVFSAWRPRPSDAIAWTMVTLLLVLGGPPGLHALARDLGAMVMGGEPCTTVNVILGAVIAVGVGATWGTLKLYRFLDACLAQRRCPEPRRTLTAALAAIGVFSGFWAVFCSYAFLCAEDAGLLLLMTGNPVVCMTGILLEDYASQIAGPHTAGGVDPRWALWGVAMAATTLWAVLQWLLAVRIFARHRESAA